MKLVHPIHEAKSEGRSMHPPTLRPQLIELHSRLHRHYATAYLSTWTIVTLSRLYHQDITELLLWLRLRFSDSTPSSLSSLR